MLKLLNYVWSSMTTRWLAPGGQVSIGFVAAGDLEIEATEIMQNRVRRSRSVERRLVRAP